MAKGSLGSKELERLIKDKSRDAQILRMAQRFAEAAPLYRQLLELDPQDPRWPRRLGECHQALGQRGRCIRAFERAVDLYAAHEQVDKAIGLCRVILAMEPGHGKARNRLSALYMQRAGHSDADELGRLIRDAMATVPLEEGTDPVQALDPKDISFDLLIPEAQPLPHLRTVALDEEGSGVFPAVEVGEAWVDWKSAHQHIVPPDAVHTRDHVNVFKDAIPLDREEGSSEYPAIDFETMQEGLARKKGD